MKTLGKKCFTKFAADSILLLIAFAVIFLIVFKVNWIFTLDGDVAPQTYALYTLVGKTLHNGELPLWNPYIWGGINNIGAPITEAFYPINWALCYIFYHADSGIVSYSIIPWNLAIHIGLYFSGLYFLLKHIGADRIWSAILAFLSISCFAFAGYFSWIVYFDGFCWLPFITLCAAKLIESEGRKTLYYTVILGLLFAMEALVSVAVMLTVTAFSIVCLFLSRILIHKENIIADIVKLVSSGVIGILLSLPVILSTIHFVENSARYIGGETGYLYGFAKLPFENFVENKASFADAEGLLGMLPERSWVSIGGVLLVLCLIGIFGNLKNKAYIYYWSLAGVFFCLLYCFGYVITDFIYYVPFLNQLRETYMYGCVLDFFAAILAGYGIMELKSLEQDVLVSKIKQGKFVLGLILVCAFYNLLPHKITTLQKLFVTLLILCVVALFNIRKVRKVIPLCLLAIASIFSIYQFLEDFNAFSVDGLQAIDRIGMVNLHNKQEFEKVIDVEADHFRIGYVGERAYPSNQGAVLGIRESLNYFNPASETAIKSDGKIRMPRKSQLQNIKYWLINPDIDQKFLDWLDASQTKIKYSGKNLSLLPTWSSLEAEEIMLYESDVVLGEAWAVSDYDFYSNEDEDEIFEWINDEETKLDQEVMINKDRASQSAIESLKQLKDGPVDYEIVETVHENNSITYTVHSDKPAIFITAELYDEGWNVSVNGEKQEMLNVDYSNRAVIIPEGNSVIEFKYHPKTFAIGIYAQFASIIAVIALVFIVLFKRRNEQA